MLVQTGRARDGRRSGLCLVVLGCDEACVDVPGMRCAAGDGCDARPSDPGQAHQHHARKVPHHPFLGRHSVSKLHQLSFRSGLCAAFILLVTAHCLCSIAARNADTFFDTIHLLLARSDCWADASA
eukprot:3663010-Rhodomonas_salina.1